MSGGEMRKLQPNQSVDDGAPTAPLSLSHVLRGMERAVEGMGETCARNRSRVRSVALSVRLPKVTHEALRRVVFEEGNQGNKVSIHSLILEGIAKELRARSECSFRQPTPSSILSAEQKKAKIDKIPKIDTDAANLLDGIAKACPNWRGLKMRERGFVISMRVQGNTPSEAQMRWLRDISARVGGHKQQQGS